MNDRMIWAMAGMLAALVAGGFVVERLTTPEGTIGGLHDVLPAARARAEEWAPGAELRRFQGRDLVDGKNGAGGAWEFYFADPGRSGRVARVLVGSHVLALREVDALSVPASGVALHEVEIAQTPVLARRLVAYGMRAHHAATFSSGLDPSGAVTIAVTTAGRHPRTWSLDAASGNLLEAGR